jgi:hypothetical protein
MKGEVEVTRRQEKDVSSYCMSLREGKDTEN